MKPVTILAVAFTFAVIGGTYYAWNASQGQDLFRDVLKDDELQDIKINAVKEGIRGTRLVDGKGVDSTLRLAGQILKCGMKDISAKPWVQFVVTFQRGGRASMEYFRFPFYGSELLPSAQPLGAEADEDMTRVTSKQIYVSWGGDGDAAYVSVRKNRRTGAYSGNFYFPNGGVADFGDEAEVAVTCTFK